MMQFSNLFTRSRFCLVGFAVFCFSSAPVCARAELSQAQMQAAIESALANYFANLQDGEGWYTIPYNDGWTYDLAHYLSGPDGHYVGMDVNNILLSLHNLARFYGIITNDLDLVLAELSGFGSVSNQLDKTEIGSYANTVDTWLEDIATALYDEQHGTPLLNKIRNLTYTGASELRVHDDEAITYLYNLQGLLLQVLSSVEMNGANFSSNVYEITQAVEDQTDDIIDYLDQDSSYTENQAQDEVDQADQDAEDSLDEASEDYEYQVPDLDGIEEPSTDVADDPSGVADISPNVQHNALITLTRGNSSHGPASPLLPPMEIDLMTTPGASSFISQLSTLIRYGWDAMFAFLGCCLYYSTFRRVRNMLIATRAGSVPSDSFSLSYDPF